MFFSIKYHIRLKIKQLLITVIDNSDSMSWKDELRAAKTIQIYMNMLNKEANHEN